MRFLILLGRTVGVLVSLWLGSVFAFVAWLRMLEPHEIAAGMSFPSTYRWQGTKRERVRLAGNAVTPPAARDLVSVVADSITA